MYVVCKNGNEMRTEGKQNANKGKKQTVKVCSSLASRKGHFSASCNCLMMMYSHMVFQHIRKENKKRIYGITVLEIRID